MEPLPVIQSLTTIQIIEVAIAGAIGSFVKDVLQDGSIELPYKKDGKLFLGFIGAAVIGAFVGMAIDGSFITALLGGYTGSSVISSLVVKGESKAQSLEKRAKDIRQQEKDKVKIEV